MKGKANVAIDKLSSILIAVVIAVSAWGLNRGVNSIDEKILDVKAEISEIKNDIRGQSKDITASRERLIALESQLKNLNQRKFD